MDIGYCLLQDMRGSPFSFIPPHTHPQNLSPQNTKDLRARIMHVVCSPQRGRRECRRGHGPSRVLSRSSFLPRLQPVPMARARWGSAARPRKYSHPSCRDLSGHGASCAQPGHGAAPSTLGPQKGTFPLGTPWYFPAPKAPSRASF